MNIDAMADKLMAEVRMMKHAAEIITREFPKKEEVIKVIERVAMTPEERTNMTAIARDCGYSLARGVVAIAMEQKPKDMADLERLLMEELKMARVLDIIELELLEYAENTRTGALQ